jgi:hypothetical protein
VHQSDKNSKRNLKVTEYLGGGICAEKAQRDIVTKHSVKKELCPGGESSGCKCAQREIFVEFREKSIRGRYSQSC